METKGVYGNDNTAPFSKTNEVRNALIQLKAKGIKDWEILDIWATILHEQGDYAIAPARTLQADRSYPRIRCI